MLRLPRQRQMAVDKEYFLQEVEPEQVLKGGADLGRVMRGRFLSG